MVRQHYDHRVIKQGLTTHSVVVATDSGSSSITGHNSTGERVFEIVVQELYFVLAVNASSLVSTLSV